MPDYIFVPEDSLAAISKVTAADPMTALANADVGPLPKKLIAVQVLGTYWVVQEGEQVVYKPKRPGP